MREEDGRFNDFTAPASVFSLFVAAEENVEELRFFEGTVGVADRFTPLDVSAAFLLPPATGIAGCGNIR